MDLRLKVIADLLSDMYAIIRGVLVSSAIPFAPSGSEVLPSAGNLFVGVADPLAAFFDGSYGTEPTMETTTPDTMVDSTAFAPVIPDTIATAVG